MTLPDSKPVKKQQMDDMEPGDAFPRWLYVHELKVLLEDVPDEYWITVSNTSNLLFGSDDSGAKGIVDLLWRQLDTWGNPLSDKDSRSYPLETEGRQ